ncbi:hypothetical protein SHIRM173S_11222 [Streptomyces hirsutus]
MSGRHRSDPRRPDLNKPLNFHDKETTIHSPERPSDPPLPRALSAALGPTGTRCRARRRK